MGKLMVYREVKFREKARTYLVELSQGNVVIGADSLNATLSATATSYVRKGSGSKATYAAYWFVYSRRGNVFTLLHSYVTAKVSSISLSETVTSSIDAIVVFAVDTPAGFDPSNAYTYIEKGEVLVVKQGDTGPAGNSGYSVQASQSVVPILTSGDGVVKDFTSKSVSFSLLKGGQAESLNASNITIGPLPLGMVATKSGNTVNLVYNNTVAVWRYSNALTVYTTIKYPEIGAGDSVYDGTGAKIDEVDSAGTVWIRLRWSGLTYTGLSDTQFPYLTESIVVPITISKGSVTINTSITISPNREGKMSRNYFFLGQWDNWNLVPAGTEFKVTKWETPYLGLATGANGAIDYYVYVGEAEGTFTKSQVGNPASNENGKWEAMVTSHKFLAAQVFFTQWAKLGSWYFNGDYMFSDQGVDGNGNGTSFSAGGRFYGDGDSRNTYTPNLYMNANTGKIFSNIGHFRNVIVEGCINNLITEIDFGTGKGVYDAAESNPNPNGVALKGCEIDEGNTDNHPIFYPANTISIDLERAGNVIRFVGTDTTDRVIGLPLYARVGTELKFIRPKTLYNNTSPQPIYVENLRRIVGRRFSFINESAADIYLVFGACIIKNADGTAYYSQGAAYRSLAPGQMTVMDFEMGVLVSSGSYNESMFWRPIGGSVSSNGAVASDTWADF